MEQGVVFGRDMLGYDVCDGELHMDNIINVKLNLMPQTWKFVLEISSISKWTVKIRERTFCYMCTYIYKKTNFSKISNTSSGVKITWGNVDGADLYRV